MDFQTSIGSRTAQNFHEKVLENGCLEVMLASTCSSEDLAVSELMPGVVAAARALDASSAHPAARQEPRKVSRKSCNGSASVVCSHWPALHLCRCVALCFPMLLCPSQHQHTSCDINLPPPPAPACPQPHRCRCIAQGDLPCAPFPLCCLASHPFLAFPRSWPAAPDCPPVQAAAVLPCPCCSSSCPTGGGGACCTVVHVTAQDCNGA